MAEFNNKMFQKDVETVEEFIQRFKLQNRDALVAAADNPMKKAALMANALPIPILTDIQRRLQPKPLLEATDAELEEHLIAMYGVKKSFVGAAVSFLTRKQKQHESIETFAKVLNQLASHCGYGECCRDRLLRDVFLSGLHSSRLLQTLITDCDKKKFHQCVERAKVIEQVTLDVEDINPTSKFHKMEQADVKPKSYDGKFNKKNVSVPKNYVCIRCGKKGEHFQNKCFAINKTCNKCSKKGHYSSACKSKTASHSYNYIAPEEEEDPAKYVMINKIDEEESSTSDRKRYKYFANKNNKYSNSFLM